MATREEYEAAAEAIYKMSRDLLRIQCDALARAAIDAAERVRRDTCHPAALAPARRHDYHDHDSTHPLIREDRPE